MIESLTLKKVATYDHNGIQIKNLKKINFIYGTNGCGKTTITKFIDNQSNPLFCDCSIVWQNNLPMKTLVYNRDFKDRNFGKGNIDGVFTLGQATKEELEAIEKMKGELIKLKDEGIKRKDSLENLKEKIHETENDFKEILWKDIYKKYEHEFKEAFVGFLKKDLFKNKLINEFQSNTSEVKSFSDLKEKSKTIFGKAPITMTVLANIDFSRILEIEENPIWKKKIIGKSDVEIAKLIQKLNLNDWVNEGRNYLQDNNICPFCQQSTINGNFKKQLEDYFDETFLAETNLVKNLLEEYNLAATNISNFLQNIMTSEEENSDTKLHLDKFQSFVKTLLSYFNSNKEILNNKIKEPSRSMNLVSNKQQLENIQELLISANEEILKHNQIVLNFENERSNLIKSIWKFIVEEHKAQIETYNNKKNGLQKGIDALENQLEVLKKRYASLKQKIINANKNVTSVQPSVDEINRILKSYGFLNFKIVPSQTEQNQYQIQREDGTIADSTLSEGEITFITFLYFIQLTKGSTTEDSISDERILIVDDPISSLDSNILFVISSLLKQIIKSIKRNEGSIKQIIILTHNVYFHKEASFIDGRTDKSADTYYWILRRNHNVSTIQSYEMENPIHNSYELLWKELKNKDNISGVAIQNTMRRIIENYFKILGKYGDDDLINKFENNQDQTICRSLICWINDGSHCIPDDLFIEHHESITDKYFEVFKTIFNQMGHPEHYRMMMGEHREN
ncbi:MAG TPA: AAA family ATPase [Flavisolibacter sp.]|nr:AAA family ATPase [Flavisolibacter sp.]